MGPFKRPHQSPGRVKLTDCPRCKQSFVCPIQDECHETGTDHWFIVTRCGGCGDVQERLITQARANEFDNDLAVYERKVHSTLMGLMRARFEEEIDRFARALEADAIMPEDF